MYEKWKKSVVHLECAKDSQTFNEFKEKIKKLREELDKKEITVEAYTDMMNTGSRDIRSQGTAIFLSNNSRRYLLTARHVLSDEKKLGIANRGCIFGIIFRVPSYDEIKNSKTISLERKILMNLGAGTFGSVPYTFSSPDLDLAIISLDQRDSDFAEELLIMGYEPISVEDISNAPKAEGSDIFTVGFPGATALLGERQLNFGEEQWASKAISLPVFTFGKVSMLHKDLDYYWTDMSIYPGNSGGPVVEKGKLVGIVSAQASIPIDNVPDVEIRIPFGKIIKTKYVLDLIKRQEEKDKI
ncbi:hypothetical protein ES705_28116 [subsurface metagenome]